MLPTMTLSLEVWPCAVVAGPWSEGGLSEDILKVTNIHHYEEKMYAKKCVNFVNFVIATTCRNI